MNTTRPSLLKRQAKEQPQQENITEAERITREFLHSHPSYLRDHPALLTPLDIPHASGGAISLIEVQVKRLRQDNEGLQHKLDHLLQLARENDELFAYLHKITRVLLNTPNLHELLIGLYEELRNGMKADFVKMRLIAPLASAPQDFRHLLVPPDHPGLEHFENFLQSGDAMCGRLRREQLEFLFAGNAEQVQSTAMIPLQGEGFNGLLAIGSRDEERFHPGMGTLFLGYLGEISGCILQKLWLSPQATECTQQPTDT